MKRTMQFLFLLVLVCAVLLSGCNLTASGNQERVIIGSAMVKYDLQGTETFGFNVNLISKSKSVDVKFVSFWGENTQGLTVKQNDDTYDELKSMRYHGYYITLLGFVCTTANDYVQIDGVTLNIDGIEQKIEFETPLKHRVRDVNAESYMSTVFRPFTISTMSYLDTNYRFVYSAQEDVTIEDFNFNEFFNVTNCEIYVDDKAVGDLSVLPLSVKKGSTINFDCYLDIRDKTTTTDYDSIYCNSVLSYKVAGSNEITKTYNSLVSQSVSNEEDAMQVIDLLTGRTNN